MVKKLAIKRFGSGLDTNFYDKSYFFSTLQRFLYQKLNYYYKKC